MQPVNQATHYYYCFEKPEIMINNPDLFWFTVENQAKVGVYLADSGKWEKSADVKSHERTQKCVQESFKAISKFFIDLNNFNKFDVFSEKSLMTFSMGINKQFESAPEILLDEVSVCYLNLAKMTGRKFKVENYRKYLKYLELKKLDIKNLPSGFLEPGIPNFSSIRIFIACLEGLIIEIEAGAKELYSRVLGTSGSNRCSIDQPDDYGDYGYQWKWSMASDSITAIAESLAILRQYVFLKEFTFMQMIVLNITEEEIAKMLTLLREVHIKHDLLKEFEDDAKHLDYFLKELKPLLKATLFKDFPIEKQQKVKSLLLIEGVD